VSNETPTPPEDSGSTELPTAEKSGSDSVNPDRIGPYRILEVLGEGGMGTVYLAEQKKPIRRRVALKIIKLGMDTKQVIARFDAERQALAMMNHPNVARVHEAGSTEQGRPYFTMEYVKGEPITKYCDRHRLTTRQRLELFIQACEGVQHAHQKGIIHRDIKPTNVLVTIADEKPVPKIIDFGVAKATEQRLTERTLFTRTGSLIGTPEYMSPEQAEITVEDVDTRTDIYSLGVLLYELLVGALPFDSKELRAAGFDEIRRKIREDEPSKPSTRLSTLGDASLESAKRRRTDLRTLRRQLSGDLDWITLKALEKDRVRRYGSPNELTTDIKRHLNDEPVVARPPSRFYRIGKFVRRHKVGVGFAAFLAVLLVGFTVTFVTMMATQAKRIASERDRANQEAETATQALDFMTALFEVSDPSEARGNSITAREILDEGADRIETELKDQPRVQGRLLGTIVKVYRNLGLYEQAEPLARRALTIRRDHLGETHPETLDATANLAWLYYRWGRYDDAEPLMLRALEGQRRVLGEDHDDTLHTSHDLAALYRAQSRYDEAESLHLETVEARRRTLGEDHPNTLASLHNLATLYRDQGRFAEAERLLIRILEIQKRALGDDHPATLNSMHTLAVVCDDQARYDEAELLYVETIAIRRRVLGEEHPSTLRSMGNLATVYASQGRYAEAEQLAVQTLQTQRRVLGNDHPSTLNSIQNLGIMYSDQGRNAEAETLYLEALRTQQRLLGRRHTASLYSMNNLAVLYNDQGRYAESESLFLEALAGENEVVGDEHPITIASMNNLADLYMQQGRYAEARPWLERAVTTAERVLGPTHAD